MLCLNNWFDQLAVRQGVIRFKLQIKKKINHKIKLILESELDQIVRRLKIPTPNYYDAFTPK